MSQFLIFALSGTLGFLVDSITLYLLKGVLGLYLARAVSFLVAVFFHLAIQSKPDLPASTIGILQNP